MSSFLIAPISNPPFLNPKIPGFSNSMHHGVDIAKHSDLNGPSLPLVWKVLLKLPKSMLPLTDSLIKRLDLRVILMLCLSQQVFVSCISGAKDKSIYYTHEGARTADALEQWAHEKIRVNKGFLVERLTNEEKWNENCVSLQVPLCVVTFLPNIIDSTQQERDVYLETIRGV